jgi:uncharacterized protein
VSGIPTLGILYQSAAIARGFTPMTTAEMASPRVPCLWPPTGASSFTKLLKKYDGDVGREQHNFPTKEDLAI